jgi:dTDP-4-dehydrorhamnose reductase
VSKVFLAGHRGMVGGAILRRLVSDGDSEVVTRTHQELDLTDQVAVRAVYANRAA